eukprot:2165706-Rhodomonas_salina.1
MPGIVQKGVGQVLLGSSQPFPPAAPGLPRAASRPAHHLLLLRCYFRVDLPAKSLKDPPLCVMTTLNRRTSVARAEECAVRFAGQKC